MFSFSFASYCFGCFYQFEFCCDLMRSVIRSFYSFFRIIAVIGSLMNFSNKFILISLVCSFRLWLCVSFKNELKFPLIRRKKKYEKCILHFDILYSRLYNKCVIRCRIFSFFSFRFLFCFLFIFVSFLR